MERKSFTITKIQIEKDGKTLFLKNDDGAVFTTIISIPNGNFLEVEEGDFISLEIVEMIDMESPSIVSKNIKIEEK